MIEESLKSTWTQINFFIHNLAQLKFSGHSEGALLSFIPKTFSMDMDGKIKNIEIFGYQKRYNPEKFYVGFCVDAIHKYFYFYVFPFILEILLLSISLICLMKYVGLYHKRLFSNF